MSIKPPRENKKGSWLGIVLVLLFTMPELGIPLLIFIGIIYLAVKAVGNAQQPPATSKAPRQEKFDDCPQGPFCFHKDKGEHHVKRGKEIDPWDRPDIDISKYQRNR